MGLFSRASLATTAPVGTLEERIKRTRIVVIDDQPDNFPLKILREMGYAIDHWDDVRDLQSLERGRYDIIILDIGGIGRDFDAVNEGAAVLSHLKKVNPSQVIVAYSGQSHDPSRIEFFQQADDFLSKSTTVLTWKQTIDRCIQSKLSPGHMWNSVRSILAERGTDAKTIAKLEDAVAKTGGSGDASLIVRKHLKSTDDLLVVVGIVAKIIKLLA